MSWASPSGEAVVKEIKAAEDALAGVVREAVCEGEV